MPWEEVEAVLPAGGVSGYDKGTLHGSGPNSSDGPRRSFAIHMRTEESSTVGNLRERLTEYIDDLDRCPVIYGS